MGRYRDQFFTLCHNICTFCHNTVTFIRVLSLYIYYVLSDFVDVLSIFLSIYMSLHDSQAGFVCSKKRAEEIDLLLTTELKVPSCWSKPRVLLTSTTGIKIADCLALCGDYGAYVIGLTDIEDTFKQLFIRLLNNIIKPILQCSPSDAVELTSHQTNLVLHMHVLRFVIDLSRFVNIHTQFLSWFQYNLFAFIVRFVNYLTTTSTCILYVLSFNYYVSSIYTHNICHDFSTICLVYFTFCYSSSYVLLSGRRSCSTGV